DGLFALSLLEAKENAHHHRSQQNDWNDSANQETHDRDAEEQPVVFLDERPAFPDALHWRNDATAKLDKVCVHEFSSVELGHLARLRRVRNRDFVAGYFGAGNVWVPAVALSQPDPPMSGFSSLPMASAYMAAPLRFGCATAA